ncbi:MAG: DMT family transporter [Salaquimonas sp.]|nr:DMT family transporter [Salaquimonas sp.]
MNLLHGLTGRPYPLLIMTTLFWAGNVIASKFAIGHISPFLLTSLRWAAALAVLAVIAWPRLVSDWPVIKRHWPFLAMLGAIGFTLFNNLFYLSAHYTTAINVAILQAATPLFVFALNFLIFQVRSTRLQLMGFVLTLAGVVLTAANGNLVGLVGLELNFGDVLMLIATGSYALYSVMLVRKPVMHWLSTILVLAFSAMLTSLPFALWEGVEGQIQWPDFQGWMVVLYTALFPSILAQLMWIRGVEIIGANRAGVFMNLVPIFASGMAVLFLGESFHLYHAVAIALVILGVWMSQRRLRASHEVSID